MKKILFIGAEVTDFLNPLAKKLKEIGYTVDVLELRKNFRNNDEISDSYSTVLNYSELVEKRMSILKIIKHLFSIGFYKKLFYKLNLNCLEGNYSFFNSFKTSLTNQHLKNIFYPVLNKYEIINFHSLSPATLSFLNFIKTDRKIVLSFWGSDLFQVSGISNHHEQLNAMKRADVITVFGHEMELTVLAKFGSDLKNKIVRELFGINDELFSMIDNIRKTDADPIFLQKYSIPENKIKLTVGYCGNSICNHLLILDELGKIEPTVKEKIHLLVPMTYGNFTKEYKDEVHLKLESSKISYTLFDNFLALDELLKLRLNSDIMIMMNKSDALSQSVCEYIYSDNLIISAIWLPYSSFRLKKIFFYETDFAGLSGTVTYSVNNYEDIRTNLANNPNKIRELTSFSKNWQLWAQIFNP